MKRLLNNKRGIKFENIFIGFLIFTLFIVGGTLMMVDLNEQYGEFGVNMSTSKFDSVFNTTEQILDLTEDANKKAFQGDISEVDSADATIRGSFSVIRLMSNTYNLFWGVITSVQKELGVPAIIITAAYAAFVLVIVFSAVYLVFRFKP